MQATNQKTKLSKMIILATVGHANQFDKGGLPYILHPLHVGNAVGYTDEDIACIAVGHDLIEDTHITYEVILAQFGLRIAEGIRCLTKVEGESYEDYKKKVLSNRDSTIVKIQDLLHNSDLRRLKGVTEKDLERQAKYMKFYWECYNSLMKQSKAKQRNTQNSEKIRYNFSSKQNQETKMTKMTIKLEIGKKYVFEDGEVGTVKSENADGDFWVEFIDDQTRVYQTNGERVFTDNPHGNVVREYGLLLRHKSADLILEYARQKAEGELAAGWWIWKMNDIPNDAYSYSLSFNDKDTVYSYEKSDLHPSNVNSIEYKLKNKLKNVKIGSKITAGTNVFVVYGTEHKTFSALNKSTNLMTGTYFSLENLIAHIKTYGEITEVVL